MATPPLASIAMGSPAPLELASGRIVLQRLIDVADAIDLQQVRSSLSQDAQLLFDGATLAGLPALSLALGTAVVRAGDAALEGRATVRLYDFGVAVLALEWEIPRMPWDTLLARVDALAPAARPDPCMAAWDTLTQRLLAATGLVLRHGKGRPLAERHLVVLADAFEPAMEPGAMRSTLDLARLLSGDAGVLSADTRARLLRHGFSHHADDFVAVGRQRSFVYRPQSAPGVVDVLEAAHARLLELRYYDALLDEELPRMYALVARTHQRFGLLAPRRMANLARRLYTLVAEVTELTGKLDAGMQVAGRAHLARAYTAALELLQVAALNQAVDRKLAMVRDTYAALYDEAAATRSGLLELIIIALIAMELVLALFPR